LKLRLEDLATRYNHIEAVNKELGEKAEALESERTAFKEKITEEQEQAISEMQAQLTKTEQDLARIRVTRDELLLDQGIRKAREAEKLSSVKEVSELAEARVSRIKSLELEVERLRPTVEVNAADRASITELGIEELQKKYLQLDKSYKVLSQELPGLEQAFKKAHEVGTKKVAYLQETEEKVKRLHAEVSFQTALHGSALANSWSESESGFEVLYSDESQGSNGWRKPCSQEPKLQKHGNHYPAQGNGEASAR
jgi:E3 ubiquitin-protein ligase BRE1